MSKELKRLLKDKRIRKEILRNKRLRRSLENRPGRKGFIFLIIVLVVIYLLQVNRLLLQDIDFWILAVIIILLYVLLRRKHDN